VTTSRCGLGTAWCGICCPVSTSASGPTAPAMRSTTVPSPSDVPDGGAANAARTKVAKGRLAAWLIAHPAAALDTSLVAERAPLGPGWTLRPDGPGLLAVYTGG
jgi:hypothetical protein